VQSPHSTILSDKKFDGKILLIAFAAMIIMFPFLNYAHEVGHAHYCAASGHVYSLEVGLLDGRVTCEGKPDSLFLYYASGGLVAGMLALLPLGLWNRLTGHYSEPLLIASLTLATAQFSNMILEAAFSHWYLTHVTSSAVVIGLISLTAFVLFTMKWGRKEKKEKTITVQGSQKAKKFLEHARTTLKIVSLLTANPIHDDKRTERCRKINQLNEYLVGTDQTREAKFQQHQDDYINRLASFTLRD